MATAMIEEKMNKAETGTPKNVQALRAIPTDKPIPAKQKASYKSSENVSSQQVVLLANHLKQPMISMLRLYAF